MGDPDADGSGDADGAAPLDDAFGSRPAASSDVTIASPRAVPPRAARLSRAAWSAARSVVGSTTIRGAVENATSPTLKLAGSWSMNAEAAFWAAASRLGSTSTAVIEPETSIVRMIVASSRGTATAIDGRASATTRAVIATR